jgi:ubiquinol-cytochrome c reductase cytochrome b subunit
MSGKKRTWLADRFAAGPIWRNLLARRVPRTPWYFGDGATLMLLLVVQVVTGALMSLTYSPDINAAYDSVVYLTNKQVLGWFIRGVHYWAAGMMVVVLLFHLFRHIALGGYKAPREGTWLIGVLLFFAVLFMSFSGYLLRWDERSITAVQVSLHMMHNVPWIGDQLVVVAQGGQGIGPATLTRIYGLHVVIVPLIIFALVGYHLYLVIQHGTVTPSEQEQDVATAEKQRELYARDANSKDKGETFYPATASSSGLMAFSFFALVVILTLTLGPAELLPEATLARSTYPVEEWWFAWYSGLIAYLPESIAPGFVVVFPLVVFLGLVLLPFIDRGPKRGIRNRPYAAAFVALAVIAILVLSSLRMRSAWTACPMDEPPPVPAGVVLSEEAEQGRQLFATHGCNSCHAVGGHGREVAVDLAALPKLLSHAELKAFIRRPPEGVAMPTYEHLPPDELERLAAFVLAAQTFPRVIE